MRRLPKLRTSWKSSSAARCGAAAEPHARARRTLSLNVWPHWHCACAISRLSCRASSTCSDTHSLWRISNASSRLALKTACAQPVRCRWCADRVAWCADVPLYTACKSIQSHGPMTGSQFGQLDVINVLCFGMALGVETSDFGNSQKAEQSRMW